MDENRAIEFLKALAYCSISGLSCTECPMWKGYDDGKLGGSCRGWTDEDIIEAVGVLE